MLTELICFVTVVVILKYFFFDDDVIDVGTSDYNALFTVAERCIVVFFVFFELVFSFN